MSTVITDEETKAAVSENLSRILEQQGKTAYWLMKSLGVSSGQLYPIIRGESQPTLGMAARIAEALGISLDTLVQEKNQKIRK